MAPSQDDPKNPFESFRRFTDEQMSTLTRIITGDPRRHQPSKRPESSESDEDLPWIVRGMSEEARRRYREVQRAMNNQHSESEAAAMEKQEAHNEEQARCPYRPADQEVPQRNRSSFADPAQARGKDLAYPSSFGHDIEDELGFEGPLTWPLRYLFTSSYSPLYLEKQHPFESQGQRWRHAFEDLVAIQSGMSMQDHDSSQSKLCTTHWVNSMMNRGCFGGAPVQLQKLGNTSEETKKAVEDRFVPVPEYLGSCVAHFLQGLTQNEELPSPDREFVEEEDDDNADEDDEDDEDGVEEDDDEEQVLTELDLYERMMGSKVGLFGTDFMERMASQAFRQESSIEEKAVSPAQEAKDGKPSLISTLTTTERTTLPDGSVHTKMVLKKRFSDGREESTETTHTAKDQQTTTPQKLPEKARPSENGTISEIQNPERKSKGWFWS